MFVFVLFQQVFLKKGHIFFKPENGFIHLDKLIYKHDSPAGTRKNIEILVQKTLLNVLSISRDQTSLHQRWPNKIEIFFETSLVRNMPSRKENDWLTIGAL